MSRSPVCAKGTRISTENGETQSQQIEKRTEDATLDEIRLCIQATSFTEASKELGIPLNTLYSYNRRFKWNLGRVISSNGQLKQKCKKCKVSPAKAVQNILARRGKNAKLLMSRSVAIGARETAKCAKHIPTRTWGDVKALEDVRKSLWPEPARVESVNVNISGGLSDEAVELMVERARLM